jgi:hypothetical protein
LNAVDHPMSATVQDTPEILRHHAEVSMAEGHIEKAFALYMRAVNAAPDIHLYKERFLELAGRGLDVAHSDELETAVVACLKTPDLVGAVENWASLLMANPGFQAAYGLGGRRAFDPARKPTAVTTIEPLLRPLFLQGIEEQRGLRSRVRRIRCRRSSAPARPVFEERRILR